MVYGLGRRCQPALEGSQREADGAEAAIAVEALGKVELLLHVLGDFLIEAGFAV